MTAVEKAIADVWAEQIGGYRPGPGDNFFEIGGHSLLAVRVLSEIKQAWGVTVPTHMIALETLRVIAAHIEENAEAQPATKPSGFLGRLRDVFGRRPAA